MDKFLIKLTLLSIGFVLIHIFATIVALIFTPLKFTIDMPLEAGYILVGGLFLRGKLYIGALVTVLSFVVPMLVWTTTVFSLFSKKGKYGYARMASLIKILRMGLNFRKGVIFGKKCGLFIKSNKPLSVLILAPPGTGKTSGIIIPTLLTIKNSLIIHDPKGELYDITARVRSKLGKVFLFDPLSDETSVFNPFSKEMFPEEKRDIRAYILNMSSILFKAPKEGDEYFINAAKSAFLFFAEWLIWDKGETNLTEIRQKLLERNDVAETIKIMMSAKNIPNDILTDGRGVLVSEDSEKQWAGVVGTFKETIELFADSRVSKAVTGKSDFTGELLKSQICSIYIKVRDKDAKRLEPLITMLIEAIGTQLISRDSVKEDKSVTFILDEFVRLGKTRIIRDLPAISRSYKVNTIFVAQDYGQIIDKYGKDSVSMFDTNCAYKVIFQQNSYNTADMISNLVGKSTSIRTSTSSGNNSKERLLGGDRSISEGLSKSEEGLNLITAQDILNLSKKECIILAQGFHASPIKAKIAFYFKQWRFKIKIIQARKINLGLNKTAKPNSQAVVMEKKQESKPVQNEEKNIKETLTKTELSIFNYIKKNSNEGVFDIDRKTIVSDLRVSDKTVRRAILSLEKRGDIKITHIKNKRVINVM